MHKASATLTIRIGHNLLRKTKDASKSLGLNHSEFCRYLLAQGVKDLVASDKPADTGRKRDAR